MSETNGAYVSATGVREIGTIVARQFKRRRRIRFIPGRDLLHVPSPGGLAQHYGAVCG